ncbi:MAG: sec-independent protein translocase protein TatB [Celeribacter sp.]|jgi:sec-independent protein translocase protein TatB
MFDIGMSELLIIGIVALIVVGPKDLPGMFRTLGRFTAKIKAMGREFSRAMDNAADEVGMNDIKNSLNAAANPKKFGLDTLKDAATDFENWDPMKTDNTKTPPTAEMTEDRVALAQKINDAAAAKATQRKTAEANVEAASDMVKPVAKPAVKKTTTKKATAKKPAAKKPAAKKPAAKTTAKTTARKPAVKKPAAPKTPPAKTSAPKTKKEGDA